jgi:hypothetical protein
MDEIYSIETSISTYVTTWFIIQRNKLHILMPANLTDYSPFTYLYSFVFLLLFYFLYLILPLVIDCEGPQNVAVRGERKYVQPIVTDCDTPSNNTLLLLSVQGQQ